MLHSDGLVSGARLNPPITSVTSLLGSDQMYHVASGVFNLLSRTGNGFTPTFLEKGTTVTLQTNPELAAVTGG